VNQFLTFSKALEELKKGKTVSREGWKTRGMWIALQDGREGNGEEHLPYLIMRTESGSIVPWTALQTDLLVDDWEVIRD
jgi:hypothetical protein